MSRLYLQRLARWSIAKSNVIRINNVVKLNVISSIKLMIKILIKNSGKESNL